MDVGTAKPTAAEQAEVRHHVIDVVDPHEEYTLSRFQVDAASAVADIIKRGGVPVIVGGTGLYVRGLIDELEVPGRFPDVRAELEAIEDDNALHERLTQLDPTAAARMLPDNRRRIVRALEVTLGSGRKFSSFGPGLDTYEQVPYRQLGVDRDRAVLDDRIHKRYDQQMADGFLDEVRKLDAWPNGIYRTAAQALGYKELLAHVRGECSLADGLELAKTRTRRFARRQQRWFRRDPRIEWFDADGDGMTKALDVAVSHLEDC